MTDLPELERSAARRALDAFGIPTDAVVDCVKLRENHVYRVRADGLDRSLRMHRVGYRSDDELRSETLTLDWLTAAGVRVPVPATTPGGEHVAVIDDEAGTRRQATMQDWVADGRMLGDSAAVFQGITRPSTLRALGSLIARFHDVAQTGTPTGYTRRPWDAAGLVGPRALWGSASLLPALSDEDAALLARAEHAVAEALSALPTGPDRFGVVHADFTLENVLETPAGLVALDFDDSGEGWFLFDLVTPAFWCSRHPESTALVGELLEGYADVRPLTTDAAAAWEPLILARGLTYLGWSADRPGDPTSEFHDAVIAPWVVSAARRYLETGTTGWPSPVDRPVRTETPR
jgi:Ser/Thr protein kinase RdoA (MazF antagonist)